MNLRPNTLLFLLPFLFTSCLNVPSAKYSDLDYQGLFHPVFLNFENTDTFIVDPLPAELLVDSVSSEFYHIDFIDSKFYFNSINGNEPTLSNCKVYQDGIPLGLPILKKEVTINPNSQISLLGSDAAYVYVHLENPVQVLAYWNNFNVKCEQQDDSFAITIPPFAKYTENSHVTLYLVGADSSYSMAVIPLRKGKLVSDAQKLRKPMVEDGIRLSLHPLYQFSDKDFHPMIMKYTRAQIEKPDGLASIYGNFSKLKEDSAVLIVNAEYLNERVYLCFNRSGLMYKDNIQNTAIQLNPYSFKVHKAD